MLPRLQRTPTRPRTLPYWLVERPTSAPLGEVRPRVTTLIMPEKALDP